MNYVDFVMLKYPPPTPGESVSVVSEMPSSSDSKITSTYSESFQNLLESQGVLPASSDSPPLNEQEIRERLEVPRASLSPSRFPDEDVRAFQKELRHSRTTESGLQEAATRMLVGGYRFNGLHNLRFNNMLPPVPATNTTNPQPDYYLGAPANTVPQDIRDNLQRQIEPSLKRHCPLLPNYFIEYKPPSGNGDVAERQVTWDGCHGARALQEYQSYGLAKPVIDNVARTFSVTVNGDHVQVYTHHTSVPKGGSQSIYHTFPIDADTLAGNPSRVRHTLAMTRNCADLADELRATVVSATKQRIETDENDQRLSSAGPNLSPATLSPVQPTSSVTPILQASASPNIEVGQQEIPQSWSPRRANKNTRATGTRPQRQYRTTRRSSLKPQKKAVVTQ